jgi:hypothetical protein
MWVPDLTLSLFEATESEITTIPASLSPNGRAQVLTKCEADEQEFHSFTERPESDAAQHHRDKIPAAFSRRPSDNWFP